MCQSIIKKYEDNDVLSMYRALTVADYIREKRQIWIRD